MSRFRKFLITFLFLVPTGALAVTAGVEEAKAIARLYSAAFDRNPDIGGLNFWVDSYEAGQSLAAIAGGFYKSPEFTSKYGSLGDRQYVERLYQNVLGRPGEQEGVDFWTGHLSNGVSRARIMAEFADSPENIAKTADTFADMRELNCQWLFGPGEPVGGSTGCLVGPAVSGVAYETPTHRGVTGPGGDFHYEAGETVRFTIGDTLLGEVTGQAQITPFELADSEVITGTPHIIEALSNQLDPFQAVTNITVLLQSVDYDANPMNGIEITPEVAALFRGDRIVVNQHWETFPTEFGLRHAIGQANTRNLFSEPHGIVNPALAMQNLYRSLGIDARTFAVTLEQRVGDNDVSYEYDAGGNLLRVEVPAGYKAGDDAQYYLTQDYEYDARGNRTRFEEQIYSGTEVGGGGDFDYIADMSVDIEMRIYDAIGLVKRIEWKRGGYTALFAPGDPHTPGEISIKSRQFETRQYDADGYVTLSEKPGFGKMQYQYGARGKLIRHEFAGENGTNAIYEYEEGRLILIEMNGPRIQSTVKALGIPSIELLQFAETYSVTYEYDADGNVTRDIREGFNAGLGRRIEYRQYDPNGKVTRFEAQTNDDITIVEYQYDYDDYGHIVREITDEGGDGTPDLIASWDYEYDNSGNVIRLKRDANSDGMPDKVQEFDAEGYLIREQRPRVSITFHYEPTGWGHIFSPEALQDPTR